MTATTTTTTTASAAESSQSPHGQLLAAFATLQTEKDALVALTALQEKDKDRLAKELGATKQSLADERANVETLEQQLELKAISAECRIAEVETSSREALETAHATNSKYSQQVVDMASYIEGSKKEKEYLLQRTASLARRDQLQKATILQLTDEIDGLTAKVQEFGDQFSSLASRSAELAESQSPVKSAARWRAEKMDLTERIAALETMCDTLRASEATRKETFVQTLTEVTERVTERAAVPEHDQSPVERDGTTHQQEETEAALETLIH
jgi:uncharacterized protein YoxC